MPGADQLGFCHRAGKLMVGPPSPAPHLAVADATQKVHRQQSHLLLDLERRLQWGVISYSPSSRIGGGLTLDVGWPDE